MSALGNIDGLPVTTDDMETTIEEILALANRYHETAVRDEDQFLEDIAYDIRRIVRVNLGVGQWP